MYMKKKGIKIISDTEGNGEVLEKGNYYYLSSRIWLSKGDPVVWTKPHGVLDRMKLSEDKTKLTADYRFDREQLIAGLFYGIEGMRIGGKRIIEVGPHLAYMEEGVPGMIPPNALLKIEIEVLEKRC
jgi:hypothetical protein